MALRKRPTADDETLEGEITEVEQERRTFLRQHSRLREDAHSGVDVSIADARKRFERRAGELRLGFGADPVAISLLAELATLWACSHPEFAAALHEVVDGPPGLVGGDFSALSRVEFTRGLEKLDEGIASRRAELTRRRVERRKAELEAELQALDGAAGEEEKVPVA